ncbi:transposase, partial [Actinotalea ferrariae CF5-4]
MRAPSTLGTFLRTFTHGHVQQIDKITGCVLAGLTRQVSGLLAGGRAENGMVFVDVDDTIREVHGYAKQAAGFGYSKVRGLNVQLATVSTPTAAPVIARARLRRGNVISHAGAPRLIAQAVNTARAAGARGQVMVRADSAYYLRDVLAAAVRHDAWFSVTARMNPAVVKAIASIGEDAWAPITYPTAVFDAQVGAWVSDAQVAEIEFTAFTSLPKAKQVHCRLVVRRVRRLQPRASDGSVQGELFADWR